MEDRLFTRYDGYVIRYLGGSSKNSVLEHRYVMENYLGRPLTSNEIVHHIDENKENNSIENLKVLSPSEHSRLHGNKIGKNMVLLKCPTCGKEFSIPRNESFLVKPSKYGCTCCSLSCRGKLYSKIQHHGLDEETQKSIDENLVKEFIIFNYKKE